MGMFTSINTAASGLSVERIRTDLIADNIANASTTRTQSGGPFRRSEVICAPKVKSSYWRLPFIPNMLDNGVGKGVVVKEIAKDYKTDPRLVYDPTHPDAIQAGPRKGYVEYSNVNIVVEMTDMIAASRAYEANAAVINGSKSMFMKALEIGR